jgi:hypothetical protein
MPFSQPSKTVSIPSRKIYLFLGIYGHDVFFIAGAGRIIIKKFIVSKPSG